MDEITYLHCWSLEMDKLFHLTLYNGYNYLSMLGLMLIHVNKGASGMLYLSYAASLDEAGHLVRSCCKQLRGMAIVKLFQCCWAIHRDMTISPLMLGTSPSHYWLKHCSNSLKFYKLRAKKQCGTSQEIIMPWNWLWFVTQLWLHLIESDKLTHLILLIPFISKVRCTL